MNVKNEILRRFTFMYWVLIGAGVVAFFMAIFYMFIAHGFYHEKSRTIIEREILPLRGDILDVNGRVICTNSAIYEIRMDPKTEYINKLSETKRDNKFDSLAMMLSDLFQDEPKEYYLDLIRNARASNNRNLLIHRNVNYFEFTQLLTFPLFNLHQFEGGLIYNQENRRKSFSDSLARRTIGILGDKGSWVGIEKLKNEELAGTTGKEIAQDLSGGYFRPIKTIKQPENGADVISTIDINMQDIVETILKKRLVQLQAESGVAILMEVQTGEIRAIVNLSKVNDSVYGEINNLAVNSLYEPGSVMKLASFMISFEKEPNLRLNKVINTGNGRWQINDKFKIQDYNYRADGTGGFGRIPVHKVFEVSSNVGTALIVHSIFEGRDEEFIGKLSEFGFTQPLDLGLENDPTPWISNEVDNTLSPVSIRQMSIGYEILVTPMHVLTFFNSVANDGVMVKPMFIKETRKNGQLEGTKSNVEILNSMICTPETLKKCRILLEAVVQKGTAKNFVKSDVVKIAGKSGTSQIYSDSLKRYTNEYNTTFVGYFPADKPKYTCLVWFSKPKNSKSGSSSAGPVVRDIAEEIYTFDYDLHHDEFVLNEMPKVNSLPNSAVSFAGFLKNALTNINVPYSSNTASWVIPADNGIEVLLKPMHIEKNVMPDVRGMNARDAVFILENYKLNIKIEGAGRVVKQSVAPGTLLNDISEITLKLDI